MQIQKFSGNIKARYSEIYYVRSFVQIQLTIFKKYCKRKSDPVFCDKQTSRASLTVRFTVKSGDPSGAGKIWENQFCSEKMDQQGSKNGQK